jgi:hypothetical protein
VPVLVNRSSGSRPGADNAGARESARPARNTAPQVRWGTSSPAVDCDLACQVRPGRVSRPGRPPLIIWCCDDQDQTVAAGHSLEVDPARWQEQFDEVLGRVAGRFARVDLRRRARAFVRGLLADLPPRTVGRSPSTPAMPPRMGCSTCSPGRCGTTTACAMTSAPTSSSTWTTPRQCWSSTRPATSRAAPPPLGATPGHRHRRQGRKRPGGRRPRLGHRCRARADRPGAVPAPVLDR